MKIKDFVITYNLMTNKEFFDFVKEYGKTLFFIDLWDYAEKNIVDFRISYANVVHKYFVIKNYFDEH